MAIKRLAMNAKDKFLFDLNGYIIIRGVFTKEEISRANEAIDHNLKQACERTDGLRNTSDSSGYSGDGKKGRIDLGGTYIMPTSFYVQRKDTLDAYVKYIFYTFSPFT